MKRTLLVLFGICVWMMSVKSEVKYIFYFIGDGMGDNQVLASEMYLAELDGEIGRKPLCMSQLPYAGQIVNYSVSNAITCSAAAGTALATGYKTKYGAIGVDAEGKPLRSIASDLKQQGWGIGIMTSVSIDHATPASFYAHEKSRNNYYEIGKSLAESDFDFFGGASFTSPTKNGTVKSLYTLCQEHGYVFARGLNEVTSKMNADKLILIQEGEGVENSKGRGALPPAICRQTNDLTLKQITQTGLDYLQSHHEKFFMMVEGGAIDWSCHDNDAAAVIHEVIDFDEAIQVAYKFYLEHPDETLIVITADHETGGLSLGNSDYTLHLSLLQYQKLTSSHLSAALQNLQKEFGKKLQWQQVKQVLSDNLGLYYSVEIDEKEDMELQKMYREMMCKRQKGIKTMYSNLSQLGAAAIALLNKKAHISWATRHHSASPISIFAVGVGAEQFTGWHDNSEVAPLIMKATQK